MGYIFIASNTNLQIHNLLTMKETTYLFVLLLFLLCSSCLEDCDCPEPPQSCKFNYDSEVYIPTDKGPLLVTPALSDTVGGGLFTAEPQGLDLDSRTGAINVNSSEAGTKYYITYTSPNGERVCTDSITISGIDYPSDTFRLTNDNRFTVAPFLDADREQTSPSGIYDEPGQFGRPDVVPARELGLAISTENGNINLRQTVANLRSLGIVLENGFSRKFEIVYALNDRQDLVSSIGMIIYFYESIEEVPQALLDMLIEKRRFPLNGKEEGKQPPFIVVLEK